MKTAPAAGSTGTGSARRARQPINIEKAPVPRGQVFVLPNRCKGCDYCIEFCPQDVLEFSKDMNAKGYHYPVVAKGKEDSCVRCQFCDLVCPELAIYTEELPRGAA